MFTPSSRDLAPDLFLIFFCLHIFRHVRIGSGRGSFGKKRTSVGDLHGQTRRKAPGTRTWLVLSESGASRVEEVGKHAIMWRTGLPGWDLRILDPMLSYPSMVLDRERAIVFKVEHLKAIITAVEVLVLNPRDQTVVGLVNELHHRVANFNPDANPFHWLSLVMLALVEP